MAEATVLPANFTEWYDEVLHKYNDPRTNEWLLVREPWPVFAIVSVYLFIVWKGPKWMEHREAFDLKPLLVLYNMALVVLSAYMTWEFFATSILRPRSEFSLICEPVDRSFHPESVRIFFILRKKNNQITLLHVYHHSTIVLLWWSGTKFVPGGEAWFSSMCNSFIHVLMYSYYGMAALGPQYRKYIWWKKYMTSMQLVQFVAIVVRTSHTVYIDCAFSLIYQKMQIACAISQFVLFMNFYIHSYHPKMTEGAMVNNGGNEEKMGLQNGVVNGVTKHPHAD